MPAYKDKAFRPLWDTDENSYMIIIVLEIFNCVYNRKLL